MQPTYDSLSMQDYLYLVAAAAIDRRFSAGVDAQQRHRIIPMLQGCPNTFLLDLHRAMGTFVLDESVGARHFPIGMMMYLFAARFLPDWIAENAPPVEHVLSPDNAHYDFQRPDVSVRLTVPLIAEAFSDFLDCRLKPDAGSTTTREIVKHSRLLMPVNAPHASPLVEDTVLALGYLAIGLSADIKVFPYASHTFDPWPQLLSPGHSMMDAPLRDSFLSSWYRLALDTMGVVSEVTWPVIGRQPVLAGLFLHTLPRTIASCCYELTMDEDGNTDLGYYCLDTRTLPAALNLFVDQLNAAHPVLKDHSVVDKPLKGQFLCDVYTVTADPSTLDIPF